MYHNDLIKSPEAYLSEITLQVGAYLMGGIFEGRYTKDNRYGVFYYGPS